MFSPKKMCPSNRSFHRSAAKKHGGRAVSVSFPPETEQKYLSSLSSVKDVLAPRYAEFIGKEIQTADPESYPEYGQNTFDRYVT
jgi:predicted Ser/Thr protein kinase